MSNVLMPLPRCALIAATPGIELGRHLRLAPAPSPFSPHIPHIYTPTLWRKPAAHSPWFV